MAGNGNDNSIDSYNAESLANEDTSNKLNPEIKREKAYELVGKYDNDQFQKLLDSVVNIGGSSTKDPLALILLESETRMLREESGSGDDSPDSSNRTQTRRKAGSRSLISRLATSAKTYKNFVETQYGGSYSKASAAARNTAGSLGSLHDLTSEQSGSGQHQASSQHGRRQPVAQRPGADAGDTASGYCSQRASARTRAGGSCCNLSRSSFDTQPPSARKRVRRSKETVPASSSTKEGGSLQNLSKVECSSSTGGKLLHKSGSLSQVFIEESPANKPRAWRRKTSSETQHSKCSEGQAVADFSSSDDCEDVIQYHRLSPEPMPAAADATAAGRPPSGPTSPCCLPSSDGSGVSSSSLSSPTDCSDDEGRARAVLSAVSRHEVCQEGDVELQEIITHRAFRDVNRPCDVDRSIDFKLTTTETSARVKNSVSGPSRASIESEAFVRNGYETRGGEKDSACSLHELTQRSKSRDSDGHPVVSIATAKMNTATMTSSSATSSESRLGYIGSAPISSSTVTHSCSSSVTHSSDAARQTDKKLRQTKKKKQELKVTVDTSAPEYIGDKSIESILEILGEEQQGSSKKKKNSKQSSVGSKKEDGIRKNFSEARREEECRDEHKKEDSGGGGTEKKKRRDEKKKQEDAQKKELLDKELKKNGIICTSVNQPSKMQDDRSPKVIVNSVKVAGCDNSLLSLKPAVEKLKSSLNSYVDCGLGNTVVVKKGVSVEAEGSVKKPQQEKQTKNQRNKKSGSEKISKKSREGGSVEDLVSECARSEIVRTETRQIAVEEGADVRVKDKHGGKVEAITKEKKEEKKDNFAKDRSKLEGNKDNGQVCRADGKSTSVSKSHKNSSMDDIKVGLQSPSSKQSTSTEENKLSRRKSCSNSNVSNFGKSEFADDVYGAGDVLNDDHKELLMPSDDFELVSRRRNKNKNKPAAAAVAAVKAKPVEEASADSRGGVSRQLSSATRPQGGAFRKKDQLNFAEAKRTPHDGSFMERLSGGVGANEGIYTSAPNTDCSDSGGDDDSVHSMPTSSITPRPHVRKPPSSSSNTPQASYANIAKLAGSANKHQVKRLTSSPCSGAAVKSSAAAVATSDQSLLSSANLTSVSSGQHAAGKARKLPATSAQAPAVFSQATEFMEQNFPPLLIETPSPESTRPWDTPARIATGDARTAEPADVSHTATHVDIVHCASAVDATRAGRPWKTPDKEASFAAETSSGVAVKKQPVRSNTFPSSKETTPEPATARVREHIPKCTAATGTVTSSSLDTLPTHCDNVNDANILVRSDTINSSAPNQNILDSSYQAVNTLVQSNVINNNVIRTSTIKAMEARKKRNVPVVFADSRQLHDMKPNCEISFMCGSSEDLTNINNAGCGQPVLQDANGNPFTLQFQGGPLNTPSVVAEQASAPATSKTVVATPVSTITTLFSHPTITSAAHQGNSHSSSSLGALDPQDVSPAADAEDPRIKAYSLRNDRRARERAVYFDLYPDGKNAKRFWYIPPAEEPVHSNLNNKEFLRWFSSSFSSVCKAAQTTPGSVCVYSASNL